MTSKNLKFFKSCRMLPWQFFPMKFRRKFLTFPIAYKAHMTQSDNKWRFFCCLQLTTISYVWLLFILTILLCTSSVMGGCRMDDTKSCESICNINGGNGQTRRCVIRALVLLPLNDFYEASLTKVVPVLKIAEDRIRAKELLPSNVRFSWIAKDDKCDAAYATIKAMDGVTKNCSHVIFGPACDYPLAAVGRITQYFHAEGTPLISVGGSTFDFQKKKTECQDEFYMLIRMGVISFQSIAKLTTAVLKRYNWNKVVLLHERDGQKNVAGQHTCFLMMQSLAKVLREEDIALSAFLLDSGNRSFTDDLRNEVGNHHSSE